MALTSTTVEERSTAFRTQEPMPGSAAGLNATARDVAELLAQEGLVKRAELDGILVEHKRSNARVLTLLLQRHLVGEAELAGFLSRRYGIPPVTLNGRDISGDVLVLVPAAVAWKHEVLPLELTGQTLTLAMTDPTNVLARDDVAYMTGFDVCVVVAMRSEVQHEIRRHYGGQGGVPTLGHFNTPKASAPPIAQVSVADMMTVLGGELDEVQVLDDEESTTSVFELKESADEAPVVKLVNMVLVDAIQKGASDIHWEPYEKAFRVRFRIDPARAAGTAQAARVHQAALQRARDRLPGVGAAHDLRREGRPPHPRQGCAAARPDQARLRSGGARAVREGDPSALRDGPDHGADGLGQDDDALLGHPHDQLARAQYYDGRRSCRIQPEGS